MIKETLDNNEHRKLNEEKINILKDNFPNCFIGDTFDVEKFKKEINQDVKFSSEGYELNFLGKSYAKYIADSIDTETVLTPNEEHNSKKENKESKNVYITGDNLDVLKHLRKSYTNQIKMIYIDPPYNTGGDGFVYNDNFKFTKEELISVLGIEEEEAERILNMTSSNSASHSAWLTFMYPRLYLGRELLKDDGVIFISIDDNEHAQLKLLCDDIFGEENFISSIANINNPKGRSDDENIASAHEYILVYKKRYIKLRGWEPGEEVIKRYNKVDESGIKYREIDLRKTGDNDRRVDRPNLFYYFYYNPDKQDLYTSHEEKEIDGYIKIFPTRTDGSDGNWRWKDTTAMSNKEYLIPKYSTTSKKWMIYEKDILTDEERTKATTAWTMKDVNSERGTEQFINLGFDKNIFPRPKPLGTIKRCVDLTTYNNDIILDFFSGSATAAQAIMEQNAEDDGNRQYIMVQLDEKVKEKSDAEKAGYKTIDEIGRERIVRAAKHIKEDKKKDIDYGFKHYYVKELGESIIEKLENFDPDLLSSELEVEFEKQTILTTWMNQDGHGLTPIVNEIDFKGYIGYSIKDYLYLVDSGLSQMHINILLSKIVEDKDFNPTSIVIYGYNFIDYNILTQLETNLKQLRNEEKSIEVSLIKRY